MRKVGKCVQWKTIGQCSKGDSCRFGHDGASGNRCDQVQKRTIVLSCTESADTDWRKNPSKSSHFRGKVLLEREAELRVEISEGESVRIRRVVIGTFSCVQIGCLNQDANMATDADSDTLKLMGSSVKKSKNSCVKGSVALRKESTPLGCVVCLKITIRVNLRRREKLDKFTPSRGVSQKCEPLERSPSAPKVEERSPWGDLASRKMPAE